MSRGTESHRKKDRRQYAKPTLTEVELRPDEAVLGQCKNGNTNGPGTGVSNCGIAPCNAYGT